MSDNPSDTVRTTRATLMSRARHDLRAPLGPIIGYSELLIELAEDEGPEDALDDFKRLKTDGEALLATLDRALGSLKPWESTGNLIPRHDADRVYARVERLAASLLERSRALVETAAARGLEGYAVDLEKIRTASETFLRILGEFYGRIQPEMSADTAAYAPVDLEELGVEEVAPKRSTGDLVAPREELEGTLLIVDDNPANRDLLARRLEGQNFWVFLAENGPHALEMLAEYRHDVVLLDLDMPGMSGFEVLERLKSDPELRHIRVIMMSALDEVDRIVDCIELGADDYLTKPINPVLLRARLGACLVRKRWREQEVDLLQKVAEAREAENLRKTRELEFARKVQLSLLPTGDVVTSRLEMVGRMKTATEVGGDYYDFLDLGEGRQLVALGDATGHGVAAGLVVGMTRMGLLIGAREFADHASLRALVETLNAALKRSMSQRGMGMALAVALLHEATLEVELSSNGIPHPYHFNRRSGTLTPIDLKAPPLGFLSTIPVPTRHVRMEPGDSLVLFSDGFPERFNGAGEQWGYDTVAHEIAAICARETSAEAIAGALVEACERFAGGREPDDDLTVVVVRARE
jgi:serine phosphatase RsbU (regulator of sigma subunit)/ActR/RegA family two-component response regulator